MTTPVCMLAIVSLLAVILAWMALFAIRRRARRRIEESAAGADKKLELEVTLDTELLKLGAGAVVLLGLALTAVQALDARNKAVQDIVTTRHEKAYGLLGTKDDDGSHVGGVYAMASLDDVDRSGQPDRFRSLLIFAKRWSPYVSERTKLCQVPQTILSARWADHLPTQASAPVNVGTQAVLEAVARVGGSKTLGALDLAATNLSESSIDGIDLHGSMLARADLSGAALRRADLENADLFCTNLYRAHLRGVRASAVNAPGALLMEADLGPPIDGKAAELIGATLNGADLRTAKLCGARLDRAQLQHAALDGAVAYDADFDGADLTEASLQEAKLGGASFAGAVMRPDALKPDLTCADLDGGSVTAEAYCRAADGRVRTVGPAKIPDDLRQRFTFCRTRISGHDENRDCPGPPPKCLRDTAPGGAAR